MELPLGVASRSSSIGLRGMNGIVDGPLQRSSHRNLARGPSRATLVGFGDHRSCVRMVMAFTNAERLPRAPREPGRRRRRGPVRTKPSFPSEVSPFTDGSLSPGPYPPAVDDRGGITRDGVRTPTRRLDFRVLFPVKVRGSAWLLDPLLGFRCPPGPSTPVTRTLSFRSGSSSLRFAADLRGGARPGALRPVLRRELAFLSRGSVPSWTSRPRARPSRPRGAATARAVGLAIDFQLQSVDEIGRAHV